MDDSPKDATTSIVVKNDKAVRRLRIGATDFANIRQNGNFYADKTKFLYEIAILPDPFFLSRPRRFGKTLLVNTLECILRGRRHLFKGLWIDQSDYDWQPYPVIRLDMNQTVGDDVATMERRLSNMLVVLAKIEGLTLEKEIPA
ncbi:MAG: AAA family ATPase, partial [Deltaproteobacteria bacterium]|nr:AAA family ATPase [Deltaproteobacteria bacterium]